MTPDDTHFSAPDQGNATRHAPHLASQPHEPRVPGASTAPELIEGAAAHLLALLHGGQPATSAERLASWRVASAFTELEVTLTELGRSRRRRIQAQISAFGETKSAAAWAADPRFSVTAQTLVQRIASGMRVTDALTLPVTRTRKPEERASLQVQFLDVLRTGDAEVPQAREQLGIPASTLASWLRNNPAFKAAVAQAAAQGTARVQRALLARIRMGSTLAGAAQHTGVHPHRISTWRRDDPVFARVLETALGRGRGPDRKG
jgi:transposase-like protein